MCLWKLISVQKEDFIIFDFIRSGFIVNIKWFGPIINLITNSNFSFYLLW